MLDGIDSWTALGVDECEAFLRRRRLPSPSSVFRLPLKSGEQLGSAGSKDQVLLLQSRAAYLSVLGGAEHGTL